MEPPFATQLSHLVKSRGIVYDLSRMEQALSRLGHPENLPGIIHVAGTNGKGTTCDFIAQILEQQGYVVGIYASPHLVSYTERFKINGLPIDEQSLQKYFSFLLDLITSLSLTEFEVLTLIAWLYFRDNKPDFVVIETGLGGRLDATVLCHPVVTVITTISPDHIDILGPTLLDIAKEKAGILKKGVPCVILDQNPEILTVFKNIAHELTITPLIIPRTDGTYLQTNLNLAKQVVTVLFPLISLPSTLSPRIAGRLEVIRRSPQILADAAHNLEGITMLVSILKARSFKGHIWYGAINRPELLAITQALLTVTDALYIFTFNHPRAAEYTDYPKKIQEDERVHFVSLADRALIIQEALLQDIPICLTGSIYFLGDIIPSLRQ